MEKTLRVRLEALLNCSLPRWFYRAVSKQGGVLETNCL